jgi:hypothetical protein
LRILCFIFIEIINFSSNYINKINIYLNIKLNKYIFIWGLGIGDWGWGLGIGDWAQSPIPNPQSPIPNPHKLEIII